MSSWRDEPKRWYSVSNCGCARTSVNHPWVVSGTSLSGEFVNTCDKHLAPPKPKPVTASLDRAVEAAVVAYWEDCANGPGYEDSYTADRGHMRAALLAALPHLGVDREALRGLAEKWSVRARANTARHEMGDGDGYRLAANNAQLCADELLQLIETNQEADNG